MNIFLVIMLRKKMALMTMVMVMMCTSSLLALLAKPSCSQGSRLPWSRLITPACDHDDDDDDDGGNGGDDVNVNHHHNKITCSADG